MLFYINKLYGTHKVKLYNLTQYIRMYAQTHFLSLCDFASDAAADSEEIEGMSTMSRFTIIISVLYYKLHLR